MGINRQYKDSVFTKLYRDKENLLELYNAIDGTNYGKDTEIEITTLDNVLYMEMANDISFLIDGKIVVLIEHQSTINPNMPLRMLLYVARIYEKIIQRDKLYSTNQMKIPSPEFIVLYNGKDEFPAKKTVKLSDMLEEYGEKNSVNLELIVRIFNINEGQNAEIAAKSETLSGYEKFVATVRGYEKTNTREDAITKAVNDCIKEGILKKFLENNSSEVFNMLLTEWNMDDALRVREKEGEERGIQKGMQSGMQKGVQKGMQEMLDLMKKGLSVAEIEKMLSSKLRSD